MSANVENNEAGTGNTLRLIAAVVLLIAGLGVFYWFSTWTAALRVVALLAAMGLAVALAWSTRQGRQTREFLSESQFELRKVVWPTRQEAFQTTLVILVVVIILSLVLWLVDMLLGWIVLENLFKSSN
jgi:preprotein translocase subunit SecE